jgi:SulP family sulfate permease
MKKKKGQIKEVLNNIMPAITVSFVALSLGAAFGILSGRGAFAGMISSAIIAIITSLFGGTRIQCSGPTGPMTAVIATLVGIAYDQKIEQLNGFNPEHFINIAIIMSGIILIIMGILKLGKYIKFIPNVVISGFMNGIAVIIWADQISKVFGLGEKKSFSGSMFENLTLLIVSVLLVFLIPMITKKIMPRYVSILSATFITIMLLSAVSVSLKLNVEYVQLSSSLKSFNDFANLVSINIPRGFNWKIILFALPFSIQLAILAYLDTLMTSLVVDKMTKENTKQNKELMAQGLGTTLVAFVGGISGAQATIRSVLMIKENATLRLAGVMVGIFALVEMILFQDMINNIPQAVFAGILMKVGYDVFDWLPLRLYVKNLLKSPSNMFNNFFSRHDDELIFVTNREMIIIIGTTFVTIFFDLNVAVALFTALFYVHNKLLVKNNPMRDLKPVTETSTMSEEL